MLAKTIDEIVQAIKDHSNCVIYYYDNGYWIIYKNQKDLDDDLLEKRDVQFIAEGSDWDTEGYVPKLIDILAKMSNIKTESI